jgi:hypothetical protein
LTGDPVRLRIKIVLTYCNPTNSTSKPNPSVYKELQSIRDRPRYLRLSQYDIGTSDPNLFIGKSPPLFRDDEPSKLGPWIIPVPMHKPPKRSQENDTHQNDTVIVHSGSGNRESIREAEDDVEENDRDDCNSVDCVSSLSHPEGALWKVLAPRKQVSSDC